MFYNRQLTIQIRQRQLQDIYGNNIIFTGPNPLSVNATPGTVSTTWTDYTNFTQGLDSIQLSWSTTETPQGTVSEGEFIPKRGVSGTVTFERDAYDFLKSILVNDVAAPLNQVEVRVTDTTNGFYDNYVLKSTDLSWCEFNALCTFDVNLKQEDPYTLCIQRTMIADNSNGWFQDQPVDMTVSRTAPPRKYHPRFSYCTEHRPNATLVVLWYLLSGSSLFALIIAVIILVVDLIFSILNIIIGAVNWLISLASGGAISSAVDYLPITNPSSAFTSMAQLYVESAGCGREHPAPLIRDYIQNVCNICQVQVDASTAEIFFAPTITIQKSDGVFYTEPNPHYNACLFFPQVKKGVRRYASINIFGTSTKDTSTFYDTLNQPVWALSDLLDHVKKVYNARWQIITDSTGTPTLHFHRKDWWRDQTPLYDFSVGGADRSKLLEGICYQPTDYTPPASMNGLYQDDPADKCGHEASRQQNGDPLSFNNTTNNPLFHGILDKSSGFGAAKFRLDGASGDYIYDAAQVIANSEFMTFGIFDMFGIMSTVMSCVSEFGDFGVLLQGETTSMPKILIWDGQNHNCGGCDSADCSAPYATFINARAMTSSITIAGVTYELGKTATAGTYPGIGQPDINPRYPAMVNPDPTLISLLPPVTLPELLAWDNASAYPPDTHVIGHGLDFGSPRAGVYEVMTLFGTDICSNPALLVNWPMYFNPYYKDTLWDWFHWIDDPYKYPLLHKNWSLKIPLCGEDLNKLALLGDGGGVKLLQSVILDAQFYNLGVITDINVSYDTTNEGSEVPGTGQYIELKGIV
jgi:hypothetical protein